MTMDDDGEVCGHWIEDTRKKKEDAESENAHEEEDRTLEPTH